MKVINMNEGRGAIFDFSMLKNQVLQRVSAFDVDSKPIGLLSVYTLTDSSTSL